MTTTTTNNQQPVVSQHAVKPSLWRNMLLSLGVTMLLFSCFLLWSMFATATGLISNLTTDASEHNYTYYDQQHSDRYPILDQADRQECNARGWTVVTIQTSNKPIYECWQPGRQP